MRPTEPTAKPRQCTACARSPKRQESELCCLFCSLATTSAHSESERASGASTSLPASIGSFAEHQQSGSDLYSCRQIFSHRAFSESDKTSSSSGTNNNNISWLAAVAPTAADAARCNVGAGGGAIAVAVAVFAVLLWLALHAVLE